MLHVLFGKHGSLLKNVLAEVCLKKKCWGELLLNLYDLEEPLEEESTHNPGNLRVPPPMPPPPRNDALLSPLI